MNARRMEGGRGDQEPMMLDASRRRITKRTFLAGPVLGLIGAFALGIAGFDGRAGFAAVLVLTAFGAMVAVVVGLVLAVVDEARRALVTRRRMGEIAGLFLVSLTCLFALGAWSAA